MTTCAQYEKPVPVPTDRFTFSFVLSQRGWHNKSIIHREEGVQYNENGVRKRLIPTLTFL